MEKKIRKWMRMFSEIIFQTSNFRKKKQKKLTVIDKNKLKLLSIILTHNKVNS